MVIYELMILYNQTVEDTNILCNIIFEYLLHVWKNNNFVSVINF